MRSLTYGVERLTAFSDGVIAIAITLLVLDIRIPEVKAGESNKVAVPQLILNLLPAVGTYALSFIIVGNFWLAHHRIFSFIRRTNRRILRLNLYFLLIIGLLPLPTALLNRYGDVPLVVAIYGVTIALLGVSLVVIWSYAVHRKFVDADLPPEVITYNTFRLLPIALVFLISAPLAFVPITLGGVPAALYLWTLAIPSQLILGRRYRLEQDENDEEQ